jgi:transcriptional regulator with XRE-family HTH domain
MTVRYEAPGLAADWLNGWLAAIGITVLIPGTRLRWTEDAVPWAVFETDEPMDLAIMVARALPTPDKLATSPIAKTLSGTAHDVNRHVTLAAFTERAAIERHDGDGFLTASVSDLKNTQFNPSDLDHGAFDPPAPKGITLWERATACSFALVTVARQIRRFREERGLSLAQLADKTGIGERYLSQLENNPRARPSIKNLNVMANALGVAVADLITLSPDIAERVRQTLRGTGRREQMNGLGFDARRLPAGVHKDRDPYVDPVVELLALAALALLPTRGDGQRIRQRGWRDENSRAGAFEWIAWGYALDQWAIDALLDLPDHSLDRLALARYRVVPYRPHDPKDPTRAYFAERIP